MEFRSALQKGVDFLFDDRDPVGTLYVVGAVMAVSLYLGVKTCKHYYAPAHDDRATLTRPADPPLRSASP